MSPYKQQIGQKGEQIAADFLRKQGLEILEANFYTRYGEIDLIAKDKTEYVFIEVKTRKSKIYGEPSEAVNKMKQKNLITTARAYLQKHQLEEADWRIDVLSIYLQNDNNPKIEYIQNAVTYF